MVDYVLYLNFSIHTECPLGDLVELRFVTTTD